MRPDCLLQKKVPEVSQPHLIVVAVYLVLITGSERKSNLNKGAIVTSSGASIQLGLQIKPSEDLEASDR